MDKKLHRYAGRAGQWLGGRTGKMREGREGKRGQNREKEGRERERKKLWPGLNDTMSLCSQISLEKKAGILNMKAFLFDGNDLYLLLPGQLGLFPGYCVYPRLFSDSSALFLNQ